MKKIYLLFSTLFIFSVVLNAQPVKVGYFSYQKSMHATAATVQEDPLLVMLQNDPNFMVYVNILSDVSDTIPTSLDGYDVVVIQEAFSSSCNILKSGGSLGMAS
ncbi:MAG: hypothetical protein JW723_07370, partial [Bacteroidales bacterium]|nr:hypothetical protein [Bacteroidales bacterium]